MKSIIMVLLAVSFFSYGYVPLRVFSAGATIPPIALTAGNRGFGMKMHPIQHVMKMHAGQDYQAGTGTKISYTGSYQGCKPNNGNAGNMVTVANGCGVTQVFMHLQSCDDPGKTITTGATGGVTGPHLHYEIRINGNAVNPIKAFNLDLCDEKNRTMLLDDAKNNGGSGGSAGDRKSSDSPEPAAVNGTTSSTLVGTGEANPVTGVVNTGPAYYYINEDGRIRTEIALPDGENDFSLLPPSTDNLVQSSDTTNEVTGCGTDTWTAMVNQSAMQVRREMMINQTFVAKADSVMAYSCFDDHMKAVYEQLGPVFSETKKWVNAQIDILGKTVTVNKELGDTSLDGAITKNAIFIYQSFEMTNFAHGLLGGTTDGPGGGGGDDEDGGQSNMPCGTMAKVWQVAKCTNITDQPGFPTFDKLTTADSDTRKYPLNMQCKDTGITQKMIDTAKGKEVKFDKINPYLDMLMPDGNKCFETPLSTGVTIVRRKGEGIITQEVNYQDGICISPGCSYQNEGNSGNGTCQVKGP